MKYSILATSSKSDLETLVELHIKSGWVPQGGVSVHSEGYAYSRYQQAMVKK